MQLPGNNDLILTGGNTHLVLYLWKDRKLVELYHEKLRNTIEIVVSKHWFAVKFKKHNAKLYKMGTEDTIQVENSWPLKMKTFKGEFRTLQMSQFRENLLIIMDASYVTESESFEVELFNTESLSTVFNERYEIPDNRKMRCLAYTPKYAIMLMIDDLGGLMAYRMLQDKEDPNKVQVKFFKKRLLNAKDRITGFVNNASDSHFIGVSEGGSVYITEANHLDFEIKMKGKGFFTDLVLYREQNNVFGYAPDYETKRFGKVSFETRWANILMDREYMEKKPIVESRASNRRRKENQANQPIVRG